MTSSETEPLERSRVDPRGYVVELYLYLESPNTDETCTGPRYEREFPVKNILGRCMRPTLSSLGYGYGFGRHRTDYFADPYLVYKVHDGYPGQSDLFHLERGFKYITILAL